MKKNFDLYEFLHNNKVKKSNNVPITENAVFKGYNDVRRNQLDEVKLVNGKFKIGNKLVEMTPISMDNQNKPIQDDKVQNTNEPQKLPIELKKKFLEIISTYHSYQAQMNRPSDISEVANTLGAIVEAAKELALNEAGDWFDKVTIKRNMQELEKLDQKFEKFAIEARDMDSRLHALYEDMGHILNRYYEISDIDPAVMKNRLALKTENKKKIKHIIGEGKVTSIPKFNIESDFYIAMLSALKGDTKFESILSKYGILFYKNPDELKTNFRVFKLMLGKSIVKGRLVSKASQIFAKNNTSRRNQEIANNILNNPSDAKVVDMLTNLLSYGCMFDIIEDPIDFAKKYGSSELVDVAKEFVQQRGKQKLATIMGNV